MDGRSATVTADSMQQAYDAVRESAPDSASGGVVIRNTEDGTESYVSEGYSTSDPARISDIMSEGMAPGEASRRGIAEQQIREQPVAARAASAIRGVPFAGEYADEFTGMMFGPEAAAAQRFAAESMMEARPGEAFATQIGTGLATAIPAAAVALPSRAMSVGGAALRGGLYGTAGGALEGAVSGYGAGTDPMSRRATSIQRAGTGALTGGVLGAALPVAGAAVGAMFGAPARIAQERLAQSLGLSRPAAEVATVSRGFEAGGDIAEATVPRSLAETSPEMRGLLDVGMSTPSAGRAEARGLISTQARDAAEALGRELDDTLGVPSGVRLQQQQLMEDTVSARRDAYATAYATPIDYSTRQGQRLEELIDRVDDDIIRQANVLMRREGERSGQIIARLDDAGNVIGFDTLPDVRQIDYITRALQGRASRAARAGEPEDVATLSTLTRDIRSTLDDLVPEYGAARSEAAEVIGRREAFDTGQDILGAGMRREDVQLAVDGMSPGELDNVRSGMRQYIDDVMASVSRPLNPEAQETAEAVRALRALTTREAQDKLRLVLGDEADAFIERLQQAIDPLAMRALGGGSPTASRQAAQQAVSEAAQGAQSPLDRIATQQGTLQSEIARLAAMGGGTPAQSAQQITGELAPFAARQRQPEDLASVRAILDRMAMLSGLPEEMLQRGVRGGLATGLGATPAIGEAQRRMGLAPQDVRRFGGGR